MGLVDLHVHSTASDGKFTPEEIVAKAARLGLRVMALTDHDSIEGIVPALRAARAFPDFRLIPGVEISTDMPEGQAHVLGYFIDFHGDDLKSALEMFRNSRERRAKGMVDKLHDLGIDIEWERVQEIAGDGSVGRPHIAQALLEKEYISSFNEAFNKYIGQDGPAYVERDKMTPVEAVELIKLGRGLPVLAHPFTINGPETMLPALKEAGLVGLEAYYKDYTPDQIDALLKLAEKYGLIVTGGTDYHGIDDRNEVMLGGVDVPMESMDKLTALADKDMLKLVES
ncbi:MAG TPA: PHP domain-containing protein [Dehalococcoidia bacterium]|nr:PHP domain-containing protein [Dehalococcoidia bacterium]